MLGAKLEDWEDLTHELIHLASDEIQQWITNKWLVTKILWSKGPLWLLFGFLRPMLKNFIHELQLHDYISTTGYLLIISCVNPVNSITIFACLWYTSTMISTIPRYPMISTCNILWYPSYSMISSKQYSILLSNCLLHCTDRPAYILTFRQSLHVYSNLNPRTSLVKKENTMHWLKQ